ncbi:hypothetical protein ACGF4C_24310 [Streptomyces sp. NPDC048197]|uniref:hypothetical protein n=1 Tax=Streptomyces sp. NPDC048197 TaxID=3365511 RepID=UPI00371445E3
MSVISRTKKTTRISRHQGGPGPPARIYEAPEEIRRHAAGVAEAGLLQPVTGSAAA